MSSGNGRAGTHRERVAHNQAERDDALKALEESDWEDEEVVTGQKFIADMIRDMPEGTTIEADATGKMRAVRAADAPDSSIPGKWSSAIARVTRDLPPWGKVLILFGVLVVLGLSIWRGVVGVRSFGQPGVTQEKVR